MENQEYLNQISASASVAPKKAGGLDAILKSKFTLVGVIGVVAFILIMIIGAVLGSSKTDNKSGATALMLHAEYTSKVIDEYQPSVKSSNLRSSSASLKSVLTDTDSKLSNYLGQKYNSKDKEASAKLKTQAETERDALIADLYEAKINGILDRVYAHKMAYEISKFLTEESQLYNSTGDEDLKAIVSTSYSSLENLYNEFNDFSEAK